MKGLKCVVGTGIKEVIHRGGFHAEMQRFTPSLLPVVLRYHSIGSDNSLHSDRTISY